MNNSLFVAVVAVVVITFFQQVSVTDADVFRDCGGYLEEPRGVIHSPGFPQRFPIPIACRWIIYAPPEKKIVLYFTQYFLREAFYVTEYDQYVNELSNLGGKSLGQINFQDHIRTVVAYKRFLVLDFSLHQMANIHLRVEEYLEDVYGFNITYEIVDRDKHVRQDTCSVNDCSFLGHCIASADFSTYHCQCFPQFFGDECQYGPFCDPDKGINMCLNEGRCRYFYGSMVNVCECPPDYIGPKCEQVENKQDKENISVINSSQEKNPECVKLGCSDYCERDYDGLLHCACRDGFKLSSDNVTCVEQEMYRVSVSVPLISRPDSWTMELAIVQALAILHLSDVTTANRLRFDGISVSQGRELQMFHFFVDASDVNRVPQGVENLMRNNRMFNLTVLSANCTIEINPEMKLLSVEHYAIKPALEGKSLTLVCTARGSNKLQFRWYKDQFLFNASLTLRSAWEVRIQNDYDDKQMSIFNVDGVTMFDKGEFSCEIEDFGEVENKSVTVEVMPLPQVEIKPLTASLLPDQSVSFRCLSPDENMRTFSYQWLRNGAALKADDRVNGEIVEDLLPSGSRLFIPRLQVSANYTCRVVNKAGAAEKAVFVFLISSNMSNKACESDAYDGVKWNRTYGGYFDLQKCPIDTADFKVVGLGEGFARRDCVCEQACVWSPPNYARCHSVHLIYLYEQLERCQLGYQLDGLSDIYDSLYDILCKAQNRTLAGDVDMFAINLHTLFDVTLRFPAVAPDPLKSSFSLKTVANFMNILLEEVKGTNEFEKRDLNVGARFVRVCEILAQLSRDNPKLIPLHNITLHMISFVVRNFTVRSVSPAVDIKQDDKNSKGSRYEHAMRLPNTTDTGQKVYPVKEQAMQLEFLQVTYSRDIFPILRVNRRRWEYEDFLSPLTSILPLGVGMDILLEKDLKVELEFSHPRKFPIVFENTTKCLSLDRRDAWQLVGDWNADVCEVIHRTANLTKCLCPAPGHYAVVIMATNTTLPPLLHVQRDAVLLAGCILSMTGLTVALLICFLSWRHLSEDSFMIHCNFILALAGINLVCIVCLSHHERETLCLVSKILLHFLQLGAFSFLLMEAMHTFVSIQASGLSRIKYTCTKYLLIGWGIPSVATTGVYILSQAFGFDDTCSRWCWWSSGHWQQYSFLVPVIMLIMVQVLVMSVCLFCTRSWTDEGRLHSRKKYAFIAFRGFLLETLTVLVSISGHLSEKDPTPALQWFFAFMDILLTVMVITTLLGLKPHVRKMLFAFLLPAHKRALAFGSFRAFVLPDRVGDSDELEVKSIQQYCADVDRSKFTTQHKQNLRNLLGSSSSGSDASGSGTGSPPANLPVPGPIPSISWRTNSAGSRSSGSDSSIWGRTKGLPRRRAGGSRCRAKRTFDVLKKGQRESHLQGKEGPRKVHSGLTLNPGLMVQGLGQRLGQGSEIPDSGYEGTESDNVSFRQCAAFDQESRVSSDFDTEPQDDSPASSCSSNPPVHMTSFFAPFRSSPARATPGSPVRQDRASPSVTQKESSDVVVDCDAAFAPEVVVIRQTAHGDEETEDTERHALLTSSADGSFLQADMHCDCEVQDCEEKVSECDKFL